MSKATRIKPTGDQVFALRICGGGRDKSESKEISIVGYGKNAYLWMGDERGCWSYADGRRQLLALARALLKELESPDA